MNEYVLTRASDGCGNNRNYRGSRVCSKLRALLCLLPGFLKRGLAIAVGDEEQMAKKYSKNIAKARAAVESRPYHLAEAVSLLQKVKYCKFDETVDLTLRLGVDTRHADQMVRGTVVLPGLGSRRPWP